MPVMFSTDAAIDCVKIVRGGDDIGIPVFRIASAEGPIFFEYGVKFKKDGDSFYVVISNFGLLNKEMAGTKSQWATRKFSAADEKAAKARIEAYFSGEEPKSVFPFNIPRAKFVGVKFY